METSTGLKLAAKPNLVEQQLRHIVGFCAPHRGRVGIETNHHRPPFEAKQAR
jgi:hypothetical protein